MARPLNHRLSHPLGLPLGEQDRVITWRLLANDTPCSWAISWREVLAVPPWVCPRSLVLSPGLCKNPCSNSLGLTVLQMHCHSISSDLPPWFPLYSGHRTIVFSVFQAWLHYPESLRVNSRRMAVSFHLSLSFCLIQFTCFLDITSQRLARVGQHIWHNYDYVTQAVSKNGPRLAADLTHEMSRLLWLMVKYCPAPSWVCWWYLFFLSFFSWWQY